MIVRKVDGKGRLLLSPEYANCTVTVEFRGDEVYVRKARALLPRRYSLDQLLSRITPDNIHTEVDFGAPAGKELL